MGWGDQLLRQLRARGQVAPVRRPVKRARPLGDVTPANLPWAFTIEGPPRTKGNDRAGNGTIPSVAYRRWFHAAQRQVLAIRAGGIRGVVTVPCNVAPVFYRDRDAGDEDNYFKALGDFLQRAGFIVNDSLIHWAGTERLQVDRARPRIELRIEAA
jgi:hypothetical protein